MRRQRRLADPMIDLALFKAPAFAASLAANGLALFAVFGMDLFIAQYLQLVLGMSPFEAGLWTLPSAAGFIVGSNLAPVIAARVPTGRVVAGGAAVAAIGLALLTQVGAESGVALLSAGSVVLAVGAAQMLTLSTDLVVGSAPPERAGSASGMSETGTELGGALGIALLGSIGTAVYRADSGGQTVGDAVGVIDTATQAFMHGMQLAALAGAVLMVAVAAIASRALRERSDAAAQPVAAVVPGAC
jgi:DHA2 family multidrug resistance protein-like MFS transporter